MKTIKTIIFDCFGVIYPTFDDEFIALHKTADYDPAILSKLNLEIDLGKITQTEFFERLAAVLDIPASVLRTEKEKALRPDKNLTERIRKNVGKYTFALLSNAGKEEIAIVYRDGIDVLFRAITVSYEVGDTKPNPKIYQTCLERLGVEPSESLFVDDNPKNLAAAQALGIQTLHYPTFGTMPAELETLLQ